MKYAFDRINRLDIVDKKVSKLEDLTIGNIQKETESKGAFFFKKRAKRNRPSMSYATISSNLLYL